ncbi:hypothetical protein B0H10DRAFT_1939304 [Mycena sp. CBHHK59/15]|nr:hypothetical protein B0H10DRAFT_1939304 [Mycena sp. CBHHK59/15]
MSRQGLFAPSVTTAIKIVTRRQKKYIPKCCNGTCEWRRMAAILRGCQWRGSQGRAGRQAEKRAGRWASQSDEGPETAEARWAEDKWKRFSLRRSPRSEFFQWLLLSEHGEKPRVPTVHVITSRFRVNKSKLSSRYNIMPSSWVGLKTPGNT